MTEQFRQFIKSREEISNMRETALTAYKEATEKGRDLSHAESITEASKLKLILPSLVLIATMAIGTACGSDGENQNNDANSEPNLEDFEVSGDDDLIITPTVSLPQRTVVQAATSIPSSTSIPESKPVESLGDIVSQPRIFPESERPDMSEFAFYSLFPERNDGARDNKLGDMKGKTHLIIYTFARDEYVINGHEYLQKWAAEKILPTMDTQKQDVWMLIQSPIYDESYFDRMNPEINWGVVTADFTAIFKRVTGIELEEADENNVLYPTFMVIDENGKLASMYDPDDNFNYEPVSGVFNQIASE